MEKSICNSQPKNKFQYFPLLSTQLHFKNVIIYELSFVAYDLCLLFVRMENIHCSARLFGFIHSFIYILSHWCSLCLFFCWQVDRVFNKFDLNRDGVITLEEFLEACLKDEVVVREVQMFDNDL